MRFKPRTWWLLSLLLFGAAYWTWTYAEKVSASRRALPGRPATAAHAAPALEKIAGTRGPNRSKSYRLSNTRLPEKDLLRSNHAIILRNALIDTDRPLKLDIPAHLRASGAPGSYIVQSQEGMDQRFYDRLKKDGVEYISYIPNNAALVRATPEQARQMASDAFFQAVLPYEPYYKLDTGLLPSAVAQDQLVSKPYNVTTLPGQRDGELAALQGLGAQLMGEDKGPFGTTLTVMAPPGTLGAIAQLPLTKEIEPYAPRRALNDLTRVAMGISSNTLYTTPNYMDLTGANVTVNMNDTGVDGTHPDLRGRVTGVLTDESNGHGTAVAGTIMGSGSQSGKVTKPVPGSIIPGAGFQGKATNATLFVQSIGIVVGATIDDASLLGGSLVSDGILQASASTNLGPTNLISNNSWGYDGVNTYDMHAASYDQATRDAQPYQPGEQPLLFVFAAGGAGNGDDYGLSGQAGSIVSPATAKNVITVGAIDSARFITNQVDLNGQTNDIFFNWTDNSDLVAWFSSCGNVGIGIEGTNGRFKPDVVAPGVFTITCRATNYIDPTNAAYLTTYPFPNQQIKPGQTNYYSLNIPGDSEALAVQLTPNPQSPAPFPNLDILANSFTPPTSVLSTSDFLILTNQLTPGEWYFGVTMPAGEVQPVAYDVSFYLFETNDLGVATSNTLGYFSVISNLNSVLKPAGYVYQYGTSMSAGAVSGMLALMQEYLQTKAGITNPAPALLKAMLINGSRNLEQQYDFNTSPELANEEGWGLPNLPNSLPATNNPSVLLINQAASNALATGQSQSYVVNCGDPNVNQSSVRVTLVWTDPPGDPAAGIALVNNLDLVVTDSSGSNIWLGNDFLSGDIFTEANTGHLPDALNNVQNVYIDSTNQPIVFPLTVTVLGARVNVNAATTVSNLIAQDYALVISSDNRSLTAALQMTPSAPTYAPPPNLSQLANLTNASGGPLLAPPVMAYALSNYALVTIASNGVPLLHQRAGANEPDLYANGALYTGTPADTNGNLFQWHFFVFTNNQYSLTNFASNVAFTTFLPPDLATQISPRTNGADLDLYVSTNPALTNLDPNVIANSVLGGLASLSRGGTETVILTNSPANAVYYVGIKSEEQQAVDFGFYAVAQQAPFSTVNPNGSVTAVGTSVPVNIPDSGTGPPALVFAFLIDPINPTLQLRNLTATVGVQHGNPSDLYGVLQHNQTQVVLNNFSGAPGGFTNAYNDLNDNSIAGAVTADGPGTLRNYISTSGQGMWMLTETDTALLQGGQVTSFSVTGFPQPLTAGFEITIQPQQWFDDYVLVPNDATNMTISVSYVSSGGGPVGIFLTNQDNVGFNDFGVPTINQPGGYLNYSVTNNPPLAGGFWYYGIYNYNASTPVTLNVLITFGLNLVPNLVQNYTNTTLVPIPTDATTNSTQICITNGQQVVDLSVGIRAQDPNLDDLVFQLTSPQGTSTVLFENRGGLAATNLGLSLSNGASTNFVYTIFTEDTNLADVPIKFAPPPYATNSVTPLINIYRSGFEDLAAGVYTNGQTLDGWTVVTNEVGVMSDPGFAYTGAKFLALSSGRITQTFATVPGASYEFRYHVRSPGLTNWWPADNNVIDLTSDDTNTTVANITYDAGEVGRAFTFADASSAVYFGTNTGNFGTNDFSIDFWVKDDSTNLFGSALLEKQTNGGFNIRIKDGTIDYADSAITVNGTFSTFGLLTDGLYHHVAVVRQSAEVTTYIDGNVSGAGTGAGIANLMNTNNLVAGGSSNFVGDLDELDLWNRALSPAEVHGIYAAGSLGKYNTNSLFPNFQITFDGISTNVNVVIPTAGFTNGNFFIGPWQTETNSFIATNAQTTIELAGNPIGVLLDNVQLVQLPFTNNENYFLPEEPLTPFIGQNPQGCWTLSVWNTRQDSSQPTNGALLGWTLQMTTSSTNVNLVVLTNGVPYTMTNTPANGFTYFAIDVPEGAMLASNILTATGPMNLFFNQDALPTGLLPGDVSLVSLSAAGSGAGILTAQGAPPPLLPGRRYFLGVQNTGSAGAAFTLEVKFQGVFNFSIIPLTNNVPYTDPRAVYPGGVRFYSFVVPTNAILVTFQVLNVANGESALFVGDTSPVGPDYFDYQSINGGTNDQFIAITTNSEPVPLPAAGVNGTQPLPPTTLYATVFNPEPSPTNYSSTVGMLQYTIVATYVTVSNMNVIDLNTQPNFTASNAAPQGFPTNLMYSFTVTNKNAAAVEFTVTNLSGNGNLELLAADGAYPTPGEFYSGSFNPGPANQSVLITTNTALTNLSGTWYLAVPNASTNNVLVNYSITAAVLTNAPAASSPFIVSASVSETSDSFTMYWNAVPGTTYQVQYSSDLSHWLVATNITAQSTMGAYTNTAILLQQARFFRLTAP